MSANLDPHPPADPILHAKLRRWVAGSLLTPAEATAIEAFEAREARIRPRRLPLLTEALLYLGAALAAAAAAVLLGERWNDLTPTLRSASVGTAFVLTLTAGWVLHGSEDPALARATGVAWLVATALLAWLAWLLAHDVLDRHGRAPVLAAGVAMTALGGALYLLVRRGLQQMAMVVGVLIVAGVSLGEGKGAMVAVWTVAVAWIVAGGLGALAPKDIAFLGGPIVALWSPMGLGGGDVGMWLGLATGIGLVVAGVARHESVLLGFGAFGVFAYLIGVLIHLFGDTAAMPVALLIAGLAVVVLAIAYARRASRATDAAR